LGNSIKELQNNILELIGSNAPKAQDQRWASGWDETSQRILVVVRCQWLYLGHRFRWYHHGSGPLSGLQSVGWLRLGIRADRVARRERVSEHSGRVAHTQIDEMDCQAQAHWR
jgi:hypothetical protein